MTDETLQLPPLEHRTLAAAYQRVLENYPEKIAFGDADGDWSYRASYERALMIGAGLANNGVSRQEPVAVMLDNSVDYVHCWTAIGLSNYIEVPINTAYRGSFLTHILNDSGAKLLIIESQYLRRLQDAASELCYVETVVVRGEGDVDEPLKDRFRVLSFEDLVHDEWTTPEPVKPGDLFAYMYTSGTTGRSKGVEVTHAHAYTYASREDEARPTSDDRILVQVPMFHFSGQMYGTYQSLIAQAYCYIVPTFSASRFWSTVYERRITLTMMVGAIGEILVSQPPLPDDAASPLDYVIMPPLPKDPAGFAERFGVEIAPVYAMSETGVVTRAAPGEMPRRGEVGVAREGYDLCLWDPEKGESVGPGVPGELRVRPHEPGTILAAYHNLPEVTADSFVNGWFRTGDILKMDEDGHYYFVDRRKDALRRRGENVSSWEVEAVLNELPGILDSAVIGVPSDVTEDEIKAVVVAEEGAELDPAEIIKQAIARLPYFMVPRYVEQVDSLPRTPTQKVQKHLLRNEPFNSNTWDREAAGLEVPRD